MEVIRQSFLREGRWRQLLLGNGVAFHNKTGSGSSFEACNSGVASFVRQSENRRQHASRQIARIESTFPQEARVGLLLPKPPKG